VIALLFIVGGIWYFSRDNKLTIAGQLNAELGEKSVSDGFYDMRIVTYDTKSGELLAVEDFADVSVEDGLYIVEYKIPNRKTEDKIFYQLCRSGEAATKPDGFDDSKLPVRCESLDQKDSSLPIVECPKTIVVKQNGLFGTSSSYATPNCIEDEATTVVDFAGSNTEKQSVAAVFGERGPQGEKGDKGEDGTDGADGADGISGAQGVQGPAGDPASDDQTISFGGASVLSISGGNSVSLASLLDNTDELASLLCANGEVPLMTLGVWACGTASGVDTDDQTLSLIANSLSIDNGNSLSLLSYLDNTDSQAISITSNILSISGNASTVNLASYLDNTDSQDLSLGGTTLTLTGDGTAVSLASLLDNTDVLASLSCSLNQIAKWNGSAWVCASDVDTVLNESQVDVYIANNGYLTSEVDGSVSNELQNLTFASNVLGLTSSGVTFNLSAYLDNTDVLASLSCTNGQVAQWNGSVWTCANTSVDTDDQQLSLITNTLSIDSGNSVSLASYLDNTDAQSIALNSNIISISGNASTVDLSAYLDNTDTQDLSLASNTLTLVAGGSVDLSPYLDNTDAQDLTIAGNILSLSGDGTTVSLASFMDNTDILAGLSCSNNQIPKWNGSVWACAADIDTVLNESQVDAYIANNGYLTTEVDGSTSNELQDLTFSSNTIGLTSSGVTFSLSGYLDNTDAQDMTLTGNTLSLTGDGSTVDLSAYLDNTDTQDLSLVTNTLSLVDGGSVDLSAYLDDTDTDTQDLTLLGNTLSLVAGGSVDLSAYLDDTDNQDLTLTGDTLALTNDGTNIDLSSYLDNTDNQNLFLTVNADNVTDPVADGASDTLNVISGSGVTITGDSTTDSLTIASVLGTTINNSEIVNETILSEDIFDGTIANGDLANSGLTVVAGSGLITGGAVSLGGTVTIDIGAGTAITINGDNVAVTADGINYTEVADALSLDATTTTTLGANNLITNANSTGDVIFQDNGSVFLTLSDTGAYDYTLDSTDNPAYTITNAGSGNVNTNLSGTGDFTLQDNGTTVLSVLDDGTFQFRNSADNASSFLIEDSSGLDIFEIDTVANAVRIGELVDDALDALLVLDGATADPTGIAGGIYYNTTDAKFRCYENGAWKDCIAELDTATFTDTTAVAFADNNTTEIFNDATRPNISVRSATSTVQVTFFLEGVSNTANDAFFASRVVFALGANPSCTTSTQVGFPAISTFTTAATHPYSLGATFIHTPGASGEIRYTVCSSAEAVGTVTDTPDTVNVSLVELGP